MIKSEIASNRTVSFKPLADDDETESQSLRTGNGRNANALRDEISDANIKTTVFTISRSSSEELSKEIANFERGRFQNTFQYLCSCVSYAIGFSNLWRFPYLCYKNGGGAFLIPYAISLFIAGIPMMYMEMAMGQFSSQGPITVWRCSPVFEGIGWGQIIVAFYVTLFYSVLSAHSLLYLVLSMRKTLMWVSCDNEWNDRKTCYAPTHNKSKSHEFFKSAVQLPSEGFWYNYVLHDSGTIAQFGYPQWKALLCLILTWIICTGVLAKGVKSMGNAMYFIALFPYVAITILVMYSYTLDGAAEGIIFYLLPDIKRLLDIEVWSDAATQIFFSLGICQGSLLTMSSFNEFHDNVKRNAIMVSIINCATSFYLGFAIFTIVGFLAKTYRIPLEKIVTSGSSLVFIVYPTGLSQLPVSPLWSCIFFLMMYIVGIGSMIGCFQTVLAPLTDRFEKLQRNQTKFRVITCLIGFLCCVPMICNGGFHLLDLLNTYGGGVNLLLLAMFELIAIAYFYGIGRFMEDIDMMWEAKIKRESASLKVGVLHRQTTKKISSRRSRYWMVLWRYVTLIYLFFISILWIINYSGASGNSTAPSWSITLGWFFSALTLIPLPVVALIVWCRMGDSGVAAILATKPLPMWGPVLEENRKGKYAAAEKDRDEDNLLSLVETRAHKKDRMKRAKMKSGRYSTVTPKDLLPKMKQTRQNLTENYDNAGPKIAKKSEDE